MTVDAGGRVNNGSRKRSRHRRARCAPQHTNIDINYEINKKASVVDADELPTEMSMTAPFCASSSSSSDRSPESDVAAVLREELLRESMTECAAARAVVSSLGCVSVIGRRREMEDAVRVEVGFAMGALFGDLYDFFGVYDGHGGAHVAGACKERLHGVVKGRVEAAEGLVDWGEVMAGSFVEMDADVVKTGGEAARTVGSTAVVAVIGGDVVVVANCGDSRAVMCRGGTAIALSEDHKPNRPDELKRIEAAGGRVINWNGHRILGVLATSRSIGDQYLKPFVTPDPEVRVMERTSTDEFLILATDGLWDVISNEYACQVVKRCLKGRIRRRHGQDAAEEDEATRAAAILVELAMARGSRDNISVIVVELNKQPRRFS
ncbi:protein phosphatase 2C 51-like isoform X1 [Punica granatum]|uniref:protein-serine/threonine phosphatase n=1 Tax=Punica granatum TaxID=22663 RepID=A0A218X4Q5_PUNGR|nr:protein phosphatase 2C 51-like isoform X1 [Punica granatum]OWM79630.1 hypothetical protein CDL15_Pgr023042 [Punica granatum]